MLYGPRDVRFEDRPEPKITKPTDAILRLSATCICGSDLWSYRGIQSITRPTPMGHEYCGIVEEVGKEVRNIKPGQFVVGLFATSDNTCVICRRRTTERLRFVRIEASMELYVIAEPNGAGKTTFARTFLPSYAKCKNFVNADLIAAGMSPFSPETAAVRAGRLMLDEIRFFSERRVSFAFETTLSGRTNLGLMHKLRTNGTGFICFF